MINNSISQRVVSSSVSAIILLITLFLFSYPETVKAAVQEDSCIECHKKPSERPKGKGAPKLSKKERLDYHAEAIHYNCKDCHKKFNRKNKEEIKNNNKSKAPTSCKECHPK